MAYCISSSILNRAKVPSIVDANKNRASNVKVRAGVLLKDMLGSYIFLTIFPVNNSYIPMLWSLRGVCEISSTKI